ncbi:conserved exported hypothetical protein [Candidatus Methylobacter favarea]|uniref:DUF4398 domain-containing protein n=1 Tax=Candidatus Methylobacter favarea TaxID=2707345 RepID=A0A8S0WA12_9GAMM|nr:hypothetical protein [Candidatus Methylobacter favarea]CAA9890396.1 conserved exported hypothetical protein [Candidatus Methylobacter favarea]
MKILKKILLSAFIAASISMSAVSTSVLAEPGEGRIVYSPGDAIDLAMAKIQKALDAITTGSDPATVASLIKEAIDAGKELNANDKVDMAKQRANNKLKAARGHAKEGAIQEAEQELREAKKSYNDMKGLL